MFFGRGNNNNGNNTINVNTSFFTSYSDTCLLTASGWNRQLSLRFQPAMMKNADGITQYAQDQSQMVNTALTPENAIALMTGFDKEVAPAMENGTTASVSVSMGANESRKVLTLGYDGKDAYVEIVTGMNENGIAGQDNVIHHTFNKKTYLKDYSPVTGGGEETSVEGEFLNFVEKIRGIQNLIPMVAHSITYSNATKAAYANRQAGAQQQSAPSTGYQAPTSSFSGSESADFLPFS